MTGVAGVIGMNEYSIFLQNPGRLVPGDRPQMTSLRLLWPVIVQMTLATGLGDPQLCSLLLRPKNKKLARCRLFFSATRIPVARTIRLGLGHLPFQAPDQSINVTVE